MSASNNPHGACSAPMVDATGDDRITAVCPGGTAFVPAANGAEGAAWLNSSCFCISLDEARLRGALEVELGSPGLASLVAERCPHVFAARPVFLSAHQAQAMADVVAAVESVVALPGYRAHVLSRAPEIARHIPGARGVFFGYDFHIEGDRIGLIEINTNAGGAMLNAVLARAQRACCEPVRQILSPGDAAAKLEEDIVAMFRREWMLAGRARALRSVAIVDETPAAQYLYPEFLLFQQLFERHGIAAVIADPSDLAWRDGALWHGERSIDMVYNRLTDFALEAPASAALRAAYLADAIVLTPHPHAHALYADKRNLALLSNDAFLREISVPAATRSILTAAIPHTEIVQAEHGDRLWAERRRYFFKPFAGYGGRAAYRGDKLTRRVWEEILAGDYVAQALVAPGERTIDQGDARETMKFDLRTYTYDGRVQWIAARMYQGQTTNFRTPGGGFAPVYVLPAGQADRGAIPCEG